MKLRPAVLLVLCALALRAAPARAVPVVARLDGTPRGFQARVGAGSATRFNAAGNLLIGQAGHAGTGSDLLVEFGPDGSTVWECRLGPGGTLAGFARGTDGSTLVAQIDPGRTCRVLALDPAGAVVRGWSVRGDSTEPVPASITVQPGPDGGLLASVPGYAFGITRRGRLTTSWAFGKLKSAVALADGRWLAALSRPERFALYDPATRALRVLPLDGFCHVWAADRAEEFAPGRFRVFGCFCMPAGPATDTKTRPRVTMEVGDTDANGVLVNTFGSPHALRVDEFGTERCATFTRGLVRLADGGMILVNTYPQDCRVEVRDPAGAVTRTLFAATPGSGGTFGEDACPLLGIQRLGSGGTIFVP